MQAQPLIRRSLPRLLLGVPSSRSIHSMGPLLNMEPHRYRKSHRLQTGRVTVAEMEPATRSPALANKTATLQKSKSADVAADSDLDVQHELEDYQQQIEMLRAPSLTPEDEELRQAEKNRDPAEKAAEEEQVAELVKHLEKEMEPHRDRAIEVMMTNKYYRKFDVEVENRIAELNYHYRTKYGNITAEVYQKYVADFERETSRLEEFYLAKTKEYAARKAFRAALVRRYQRNRALKQLDSLVERQRTYASCIKWNWVTRKKYDDWIALGAAQPQGAQSLHQQIRAKEKERKESSKKEGKTKRRAKKPDGPFSEMNEMGYQDHPLYVEPHPLDSELAVLDDNTQG